MLERGFVQIYTGDGKGKTTAVFGLALRAAGAGNKVLIYRFLKPAKPNSGECAALQQIKTEIKIEALDVPWDMSKSIKDEKQTADAEKAIHEVLDKIADTAQKKLYDMIILDEIVYCLSQELAKLEDIKNIIEKRDSHVEIVLTGRGATKGLMKLADLVTEMKKVKHPFDKGIKARRGIEF